MTEMTAAEARAEADRLLARGEPGDRKRAVGLLIQMDELAKAEASRPAPPRKVTRPGVLNKVASPDLIKSVVKTAVHEALVPYTSDIEWVENQMQRLIDSEQRRYAPITRGKPRPDHSAEIKRLRAAADDCRRDDPTRAAGYRDQANALEALNRK
jgi:hypothetical protein